MNFSQKIMLYGIYACLLLPIGGMLLRLPLLGGAGLLLQDIVVLLLCSVSILFWIHRPQPLLSHPLFWLVCLLFLWMLGGLLLNIGILGLSFKEGLEAGFYFFRYFSYLSLLFLVSSFMPKRTQSIKTVLYVSTALIALLGFLQLKYFPSFLALRMNEMGWDPHEGRLLSTWFDPNFLGGYFALVSSLIIGDIFTQYKKRNFSFLFFILSLVVVLLLCSLALTFSRSAYLAFAISFFVFALFAERKLILI